MKFFIYHTKLKNQSGNFSESQRSEVKHKISGEGRTEESQWLRSYVNDPEGNFEVNEVNTLCIQQQELHQTQIKIKRRYLNCCLPM
jgi:hypothetical protein